MTGRRIAVLSVLTSIGLFVLMHLAVFMPQPFPFMVLWIPGWLAEITSRYILHDPGTHGLGYANPVLILLFAYLVNIPICVAAGVYARSVMKRRERLKARRPQLPRRRQP